jgi:pseudouridine-5'-phosphate glycosidase/pseudouridine kinase
VHPVTATERISSDASSVVSEPLSTPSTSISSTLAPLATPDVVVAGALAVDFSCDYAPFATTTNQVDPLPHTSNPATISQSLGGVAHNIAKAAHLLGGSVHLHSAVGEDLSGRAALSQLEEEGMSIAGIEMLAKPARTAQYVAVNNANKDLALAMADMSILETIPQATITDLATSLFKEPSSRPSIFVADANWSSPALHTWLQAARHLSTITIFEPVSTAKAIRLYPERIPHSTRRHHHPKHIRTHRAPRLRLQSILLRTPRLVLRHRRPRHPIFWPARPARYGYDLGNR